MQGADFLNNLTIDESGLKFIIVFTQPYHTTNTAIIYMLYITSVKR